MNQNFIFFGTDQFSIFVLEELKSANFLPKSIVTAPDRPAGRGQKMQKTPVKIWAEKNNIEIFQPEKLDDEFYKKIKDFYQKNKCDFFVVASYGKIIPKKILEITKFGALNVHPSLLPLYRGSSPIESAMLDDSRQTGVSIMLMDEKMDHGPIIAQEQNYFIEWPSKNEVEEILAKIGGKLLIKNIEPFINNKIQATPQDESIATFTKKIEKEIGLIDFDPKSLEEKEKWQERQIFLKIQALNPWPSVYFFINHNDQKIRVKITKADFADNKLVIEKVIPEGRKEMSYQDFLKGFIK